MSSSSKKEKKSFGGNATAFIRKRKEKWRPSLNGTEDATDGVSKQEQVRQFIS